MLLVLEMLWGRATLVIFAVSFDGMPDLRGSLLALTDPENIGFLVTYTVVGAVFAQGERVDVIGTSKGHGFQGVVKRHHFGGGVATHGSMFHRAPGSIGASSFPSRVVKGMRMAGHMGQDRVTVRNLKVLRIDADNNLMVVRGAVPGANGGYVLIRKAVAAKPEPQPQLQEKPKKGKK